MRPITSSEFSLGEAVVGLLPTHQAPTRQACSSDNEPSALEMAVFEAERCRDDHLRRDIVGAYLSLALVLTVLWLLGPSV